MSTPHTPDLPPWASEVIDLYESGACAQFILHGNVDDLVLLPVSGAAPRLVALDGFLRERLLARFDVVISYDVGNGIRVEKGGDRFAEWPPAAKEATLAEGAARGDQRAHASTCGSAPTSPASNPTRRPASR